jgi:hypothetical protein
MEEWMRMRRRSGRLVLAATVCALLASSATASAARQACHSRWPVVAYRAGGQLVKSPARSRSPRPCATATGYGASESTIAVTNSGTVFYSPANTENSLARSFDRGATWRLVYPPRMQYTSLWNTVDPHVVVDRRTGRVFWAHTTYTEDFRAPVPVDGTPLGWLAPTAIANAHGFQVFSSPDDGRTWTTADYRQELTADWEKIFVGPPPPQRTGADQPAGYPDVVYLCANAPVEVSGPGRACYRSLDGGRTFSFRGYLHPSQSAPASACPALAANTGVVGRDGTTYQPQSCSDRTYLTVSRDEGATYTWLPVTGAPASSGLGAVVQLAIDAAGNLYVLWKASDQLYLAISRDGGHSWSSPLAVAAPGLRNITLPALAAGPRGHVGVVYYATKNPSSQALSAYITETRNGLGPRPVFYGAAINDPAHPIFTDHGNAVTPRADFVGATYDRFGVLWAGVVKQLGPPDSNSSVPTTGYVGRLVFP